MSEPTSDNWRATIRSRLLVGAAIFMLWAVGIQARLLYLQVHKHHDLQARAENQSARTMDISAKRGDILDRHGRVLAYSVDADSVYGVPSEIENAGKTASMLCAALTDCAPKEQDALTARLRQKRAFVYVRRRVTPHAGDADRRARPRRHRIHQGRPPLLSEEAACRAAAGLRRRRQQRARRHRGGLRQPDQRRARQAAVSDRRARARLQPARAPADRRRDRRADDRRVPAARCRARAARCGRAATAPPAARC